MDDQNKNLDKFLKFDWFKEKYDHANEELIIHILSNTKIQLNEATLRNLKKISFNEEIIDHFIKINLAKSDHNCDITNLIIETDNLKKVNNELDDLQKAIEISLENNYDKNGLKYLYKKIQIANFNMASDLISLIFEQEILRKQIIDMDKAKKSKEFILSKREQLDKNIIEGINELDLNTSELKELLIKLNDLILNLDYLYLNKTDEEYKNYY